MQVVLKFKPEDRKSPETGSLAWLLSTEAPDEAVLSAVHAGKPAIPLGQLLWRCKRSQAFFAKICAVLSAQLRYHDGIWSYAMFWKDPEGTKQWLQAHSDEVQRLVQAPLQVKMLQVRVNMNQSLLVNAAAAGVLFVMPWFECCLVGFH